MSREEDDDSDESSDDEDDSSDEESSSEEEDEPDWLKEELIATKTRARWGESGASVSSKVPEKNNDD